MEEKNKAMGQKDNKINQASPLQELTKKVEKEIEDSKNKVQKVEDSKEVFKNNILKTGVLIKSAYIYDEPSKKQIGIIGKGEKISYTDSIDGWAQLSNGNFISKKWIK